MTYLKAAELEVGDKFQYHGKTWKKVASSNTEEVLGERTEKDGTIVQCHIGNMEEISI